MHRFKKYNSCQMQEFIQFNVLFDGGRAGIWISPAQLGVVVYFGEMWDP